MPKFNLGHIVATPGALDALKAASQSPVVFLNRHVVGDWGDLDSEDCRANEMAIAHESEPENQARVFSVYHTRIGTKLWVITEGDRSATTILLPDEY